MAPTPGLFFIASQFCTWGLLLGKKQWTKRIGDTPHCPRCDYILTGLTPVRCPECGYVIPQRMIVYGERHFRPRIAWTSRTLIAIGVLLLALAFSGFAGQFDWIHYRAASSLVRDLPGNDFFRNWAELQRRAAASQLSAEDQGAWEAQMVRLLNTPEPRRSMAQAELAARSAKGRLAAATRAPWAAQLIAQLNLANYPLPDPWPELRRLMTLGQVSPANHDALVDAAFRQQTGPLSFRTFDLINWLGGQYDAHALTQDQERRFIRNMMNVRLVVRPRVGPADHVPYCIIKTGRGPLGWWEKVNIETVAVDDRVIEGGGGGTYGNVWESNNSAALDPQPVGRHRLRVHLNTGIDNHSHSSVTADHLLAEWPTDLTADFEVAPRQPPIRLLDAPAPAVLAKAFRADAFDLHPNGGYYALGGYVYCDALPVNVAFTLHFRIRGKEYDAGRLAINCRDGSTPTGSYAGLTQLPPGPPPTSLDLILRSDEPFARDTVDLTEIWQGEIVLPNIPVKPATPPATTTLSPTPAP